MTGPRQLYTAMTSGNLGGRTATMRRVFAGCVVVALSMALSGCGDDDAKPLSGPAWDASTDPVDTAGLVWAADSQVHLGDGSVIETEEPLAGYVVAGDGVYFVAGSPAHPESPPRLRFAGPGGVDDTDAYADPETLRASPDGRHLAFIDFVSGPTDDYDTPVAEFVVVDLEEGAETVRTSEGFGDPDSDDLADLYEDSTTAVLGVTEDTVYVDATGDIYAYDLTTGQGEPVPDDLADSATPPWDPAGDTGVLWNPAHSWAIDDNLAPEARLVAEDGTRVAPRIDAENWTLDAWVDDETALGLIHGSDAYSLFTCAVPTGACERVPGTEDGALLPNGVVE